ncbi:MAG: shikimate dehydrogenase [Firmicutes bacterium]|nr:shikimate dehydrogenase [Bacillota bacterium]MCM1400802.1 shikimate dehydrogenase [Bacteroides sp.]MCM1477655.1 shikimate dehydrogenase [Bacteroides sp.]
MSNTKKIFGLVGHPLGHSFSGKFFNEKFTREGIDACYLNFDIPLATPLAIGIEQLLREHSQNLKGFNVTIPYKEEIMPLLDNVDREAAAIGAVNVVNVIRSPFDNRLTMHGFNTDHIGFAKSILPFLGPLHKNALVLGSGGASKAVCYALRKLGIEPLIVSRTPASGQISYSELTPEIMESHKVIVNCTPLGTFPHVETCPKIPFELIGREHLCYDLVYNPAVTTFMQRVSERGACIINGAEMLRIQALEAWKIWNNLTPDNKL